MADLYPYGRDVPYADPGYQPDGVHRYPIDCGRVQAAWSYIHQADNRRPYTADQLTAIEGRIRAAMKRCGHTVSDEGGRSTVQAIERRYTPGRVDLRPEHGRIGGYGAVFNRYSRSLAGGFVEQVLPGAFDQNRGDDWPNVVSRFNHDNNMMLGSTAAETLRCRVDEIGLDYEVQPPASRRDILELVERGDVRHSSFEFKVVKGGDEWAMTDQGYPLRSLVKVQLFEVGPVVAPAYPDTTAALRSLAERFEAEFQEVERRAAMEDLRGFFIRTDVEGQSKKPASNFGPAVKMALLKRRHDPYV